MSPRLTLSAVIATCLLQVGSARAQAVPPLIERDSNWRDVSNVMMVVGAASVFLTPRVYYSDPTSTVGWKARWHVSMLAPAMSMTAATLLVDGPIRDGIESTRPGCSVDATEAELPGSGCESYGGPSTQAFASWGTTGAGLTIFLVDTIKYSNSEFNFGSFAGNVLVPFTTSMVGSIARGVGPGDSAAHESAGQIVAGSLTGLATGAILGLTYSLLQRPNCGYGDTLFCW